MRAVLLPPGPETKKSNWRLHLTFPGISKREEHTWDSRALSNHIDNWFWCAAFSFSPTMHTHFPITPLSPCNSILPEFCWDHGSTRSGDIDNKDKREEKRKQQQNHRVYFPEPIHPAPAVSSAPSPFLHFSLFWLVLLFICTILNSCTPAPLCSNTLTHVLYLAMTMYSSATVQSHL